jgi:hypothetical protein
MENWKKLARKLPGFLAGIILVDDFNLFLELNSGSLTALFNSIWYRNRETECQFLVLGYFVNLTFCQLDILSLDIFPTWHFITLTFFQPDILSHWHFINLTFYQLDILSTWHFLYLTFSLLDILSVTFFQFDILSTCQN